jgi:hypothetical protein
MNAYQFNYFMNDYQLLISIKSLTKTDALIISMFHNVPGVPLVKMERFAGVDTN